MASISDLQIAHNAERSLNNNPLFAHGRVRILVRCGWIILTGEVSLDLHRWAAEADVRYLPGVVGVENRLTVRS